MELRTLGRTGVQVSPLCLGAMMFGPMGEPDHAKATRIIHGALDAGVNFVELEAVEQLAQLADDAGLTLIHLAIAFSRASSAPPTCACPPTCSDRIDEIVPPGTNFGWADAGWTPPAITDLRERRR